VALSCGTVSLTYSVCRKKIDFLTLNLGTVVTKKAGTCTGSCFWDKRERGRMHGSLATPNICVLDQRLFLLGTKKNS